MKNYIIDDVMIVPTMECNFLCGHCAFDSGPDKKGKLNLEQMCYYVDQLPGARTKKLDISGGGEPMLHKDTGKVIAYADSVRGRTGYPQEITLTTNGHWATSEEKARETIETLRDYGLDKLCISNSRFHNEFNQNVDMESLEKVKKISGSLEIDTHTSFLHHFPLGRGREGFTKEDFVDETHGCDIFGMIDEDANQNVRRGVSVFPDGLYACCWKKGMIGEVGDSLNEAVGRALSDPLIILFGDYGISDPVKYMKKQGMVSGVDPEIFECSLCEDVFDNESVLKHVKANAEEVLKHFRANEKVKERVADTPSGTNSHYYTREEITAILDKQKLKVLREA